MPEKKTEPNILLGRDVIHERFPPHRKVTASSLNYQAVGLPLASPEYHVERV